ncbi:transcription initiation factor TFIID subunit 7 [Nematocida ausubeli]|nr:transcription initiation factor TFIID subunit 7 [Nematocida ausubeli]KAI5148911.1 transcription initiation factor TFIID subunit 7 [Nematocida ausubeli]KAI5160807.1 transcription initiation factor TFIID subunit 7 [Nematocida ausubeli]
MEDQFIIRPPESIRRKVSEDVKKGLIHKLVIKMVGAKEGTLTYENKTYRGVIIDLPCIIESHKTLDNRQFIKIADISKMFIFTDKDIDLSELEKESISGITPPMKYVKTRRFRKRLTKAPIVEEIENEVAALLEKDKEAIRVDVQILNKDGSEEEEEDTSSLAAEIELNLLESEKNVQATIEVEIDSNTEERREKERLIQEIMDKIKEKKEQVERITNPILKKRFYESIQQLEKEKDEIQKELDRMDNK